MILNAPPIDDRNFEDIVSQALTLAKHYCPEWKAGEVEEGRETNAPGTALVYLFAHLMEIIITRLNQVPEKNFLAFLDFIGADLQAPTPAGALLQFTLSEGAETGEWVPAGSQVAAEETRDTAEQIFETCDHLVVTPVKLVSAFVLDPAADCLDNRTGMVIGAEQDEFDVFKAHQLIEHILYIGDDRLFGFKEKTAVITLEFVFSEGNKGFQDLCLSWEYSREEGWWQPLDIEPVELSGNPLTVTFNNPGNMAKDNVSGYEHYWIRIKLAEAVTGIVQLPGIKTVTGSIIIKNSGILPDACLTNSIPIENAGNFYPFGPVPIQQDVFYIASDEVFSKTGAAISISIMFAEPGKPDPHVLLAWEYWNGELWQSIAGITDPTENFTKSTGVEEDQKITFICPAIVPEETDTQSRYWVRVRIVSGHYGQPAHYDFSAESWREENLNPPLIASISLDYSYTSDSGSVEKIILKNNTRYSHPGPGAFLPFVPLEEQYPALYLGFDTPFCKDSQSLFFQVEENPGISRRLWWEYSGPEGWKRLNVKDNTDNLSTPGHVRFIGPGDFTRRECFDQGLYWLRVSRIEAVDPFTPKLQQVYMNTVWAENVETIKDELLGSSDGSTNQNFKLNRYPVLPGHQVWVVEREMPAKEEYEKIIEEEGEDAVVVTRDEKGIITEIRVRWHEVNNFYASDANSRHYVMEPASGKISFGDGTRGMVPPIGKDNILCTMYQTGGGVQGNVDIGKITQLKFALPYIDSVTNVLPAAGGTDAETLDEIKERVPFMLKHRDRAVTTEDFQWLLQEAPGEIAISKCIPSHDSTSSGKVTLIIVPDVDHPKPFPTKTLIAKVESYLNQRILATLSGRGGQSVRVKGPEYIEVDAEAVIVPRDINQAGQVEEQVINTLDNFLHPLRGGSEGTGWQFGRDVLVSEVMQVLQNTEGVDFVKSLRLKAETSNEDFSMVAIGPGCLPCSGKHNIKMEAE